MNETFIVTAFVIIEEMCQQFLPPLKYRPKMWPSEIVLVAVIAARYFHNHLERALLVMGQTGYIPAHRRLSISRFNRQLHQQLDTVQMCLEVLLEVCREGDAFILDSLPMPVCKRKRAKRCRKVKGRLFCGYCAAKDEKFFGWRLHLVCDPLGFPVNFVILPASLHDLTPIYELSYELPDGASLFGDKAYNDAEAETLLATEGIRLIPIRRKNMHHQHEWGDEYDLHLYRKGIETVNSQLESMGLERLRARTNNGFFIKVLASLIALWLSQEVAK